MKKISVIVPVYKTEEYLRKCVESILAQTYTNLEVILVDDGSPDGSGKICDEYAERDERVRVIHKENGGLSSARNAGLDVATGDYITFVDSDDYLDDGIYEKLVTKMEETSSDIVMMNIQAVDEEYNPICPPKEYPSEWISPQPGTCMMAEICKRRIDTSVCSKLFSFSAIRESRFRSGVLNEDFLFMAEALLRKEIRCVLVNDVGYFYYTRQGSITKSGFGKSLRDAVYNTEEVKKMAEKLHPELVPLIGAYAAYQARTAILVMTKKQYRENDEFTRYCREVIRANKRYVKGSFMNRKEKLFCCMYIKFPRFTKWFFDLLRRGRR